MDQSCATEDSMVTLPSGQEVRARLSRPATGGGIERLAQCWTVTDISLLVEKKIKPGDLPPLLARLRGGWGDKLVEMASLAARDERPCDWQSACALSVLFNDNGAMGQGLKLPRPFLFEILPLWETKQILLNLRLFGFACKWAAEASAALRLLMRDGMTWQQGRDPEIAKIADMSVICHGTDNLPDEDQKRMLNTAFLNFVTPLSLRRQGAVTADVTALPMSLVNRLCGLARWHDFDLEVDRRQLKYLAKTLRYDSRDMQAESWNRISKRQGRRIPMAGLQGTLVIEGDLSPFIPYFWLGQDSFVGSHTASGMGRYYLELVGTEKE